MWQTWADALGIPRLTFMAAYGAGIERGGALSDVFDVLDIPDWRAWWPAIDAAYGAFGPDDLYPDVLPAMAALKRDGWRIAVIGNQPARRSAELRALGVLPDVMAMSAEMGFAKPEAAFFARALELMGSPASRRCGVRGRSHRQRRAAVDRGRHARRVAAARTVGRHPGRCPARGGPGGRFARRAGAPPARGMVRPARGKRQPATRHRVGLSDMPEPSTDDSSNAARTDARPAPEITGPLPLRSAVREAVERAWGAAVRSGALSALPSDVETPLVEVARPANPDHGDLSSNLALKLARPLRQSPMAIATVLAAALTESAGASGSPIESVTVAAPGFLNVRVAAAFIEASLDRARAAGDGFGRVPAAAPRHVNVEFVSANPTGPLTVGNARGAFVGDLLCRVLEAGGQQVTREYYFNDSGGQVRVLGASIAARRQGQELPEEAYRGDYVEDLAASLPEEIWARATDAGADRDQILGGWASERIRAGIEASLSHLGVHFDVWKSEASLHTRGLGRACRRAPARRRPRLPAGRRDVVPLDHLR